MKTEHLEIYRIRYHKFQQQNVNNKLNNQIIKNKIEWKVCKIWILKQIIMILKVIEVWIEMTVINKILIYLKYNKLITKTWISIMEFRWVNMVQLYILLRVLQNLVWTVYLRNKNMVTIKVLFLTMEQLCPKLKLTGIFIEKMLMPKLIISNLNSKMNKLFKVGKLNF